MAKLIRSFFGLFCQNLNKFDSRACWFDDIILYTRHFKSSPPVCLSAAVVFVLPLLSFQVSLQEEVLDFSGTSMVK